MNASHRTPRTTDTPRGSSLTVRAIALRIALGVAVAAALADGATAAPSTPQSTARPASQPLDRTSFDRIRATHAGRPLVVHIWGVTCAPCVAELPRWGALRRAQPGLPLVLIQADASPPAVAERRLVGAGLAGAESWTASTEPDEFVRASIDPEWQGDMPRTLLIAADGHVERIQGSADFAQVRRWLAAQREVARPAR